MIEQAIEKLEGWMTRGGVKCEDCRVEVKREAESPWIEIAFWPPIATTRVPMHFVVWKFTGAVHRVLDGEVQDPELFALDP